MLNEKIGLLLFVSVAFLSDRISFAGVVQDTPNVVLIFADDLGYGDVSCFDRNSKIKTPHMDKLAKQGMRFIDAHTASSVCTPSRYALLTGRYAWRTRLKSGVLTGYSKPLLDENRPTLGTLMKNKQYATACIGKWHLGMTWHDRNGQAVGNNTPRNGSQVDHRLALKRTPIANGFDYFFGISASLDMPPYVWIENDKVVKLPKKGYRVKGGRPGPIAEGWRHEDVMPRIADQTIEFIKKNKKNPFFVYVPLNSPHTPHAPSKKFLGKSGLDKYGDFVVEVDHTVGRIVDAIDQCGLTENTIVIVTSDNGPEVNMYHRRKVFKHDSSSLFLGAKRDNWEGGHRVPFIVRWPKKVKASRVCDQTIGTVDLMATLADITGQELPSDVGQDSLSFASLLEGKKDTKRKNHSWVHHSASGKFAIRKGKWKMLMHSGSGGNPYSAKKTRSEKGSVEMKAAKDKRPMQLFDLQSDPSETLNVVDKNKETAMSLRNDLTEIILSGRSTPGNPEPLKKPYWKQLKWIEKIKLP